MKIDKGVVEYVAHLGRLALETDEIELYTAQLNSILEYMDALSILDTEGVEPTSHAIPVTCTLREDLVKDSFSIEDSVLNAPEKIGSSFKVPPIIEVEE